MRATCIFNMVCIDLPMFSRYRCLLGKRVSIVKLPATECGSIPERGRGGQGLDRRHGLCKRDKTSTQTTGQRLQFLLGAQVPAQSLTLCQVAGKHRFRFRQCEAIAPLVSIGLCASEKHGQRLQTVAVGARFLLRNSFHSKVHN